MALPTVSELEDCFVSKGNKVDLQTADFRTFMRNLLGNIPEGGGGGSVGDEGAIQMSDGAGGFADSGFVAAEGTLFVSAISIGFDGDARLVIESDSFNALDSSDAFADFGYNAKSHTFMVGENGDVEGPVFNEDGSVNFNALIAINNGAGVFLRDDANDTQLRLASNPGIPGVTSIASGEIADTFAGKPLGFAAQSFDFYVLNGTMSPTAGPGITNTGALKLSAANTISAEAAGVSTHKALINIDGTDYQMLLIEV